MLLYLFCSIVAQTICWLTLDHLSKTLQVNKASTVTMMPFTYSVDEVGGLIGPASRDVFVLDLNLLREDMVTDLLPRLADVGSLFI